MSIAAPQQLDGNRRTINSNQAFLLKAPWTFVTATTGAVGAHTLFTVTGDCLVSVFGICNTDLTGAATIEVGVTGNTAGLIAQVADATALDDGDVWVDATPAVGVEAIPTTFVLNDGADIILTIGSTAVTAGQVDFYITYRPLEDSASITVTTPA
jgi:hypothetical protein